MWDISLFLKLNIFKILFINTLFFINVNLLFAGELAIINSENDRFLLDSKIYERARKEGIEIHDSNESLSYDYSNSPINIEEIINNNFDINKSDYPFLLEKSIVEINNNPNFSIKKQIQDELINRVIDNKELFKYMIGYHNIFTLKEFEFVRKIEKQIHYLEITGRFGQVISGICKFQDSNSDIVMVLITGRGTTAKAIMGMSDNIDYSNNFGKHSFEKLKINVCAIDMFPHGDFPLHPYGLSGRGVSILAIEDFLHFIKQNYENQTKKLILGGISNGGHIAEYTSVISEDVDAVISASSASRSDYSYSPYSKLSLDGEKYRNSDKSYAMFDSLFRSGRIYRLISPKPLIISIGTHDGHIRQSDSDFPDKIDQLKIAKEAYGNSECLKINLFRGGHAFNPNPDIKNIQLIIQNCL